MEYEIDECAYGEYCMCATCFYQNDCSNCADCISNNKQIHDIWSCIKYMRKEHLRKGTGSANTQIYITEDGDTRILDAWQVKHMQSGKE